MGQSLRPYNLFFKHPRRNPTNACDRIYRHNSSIRYGRNLDRKLQGVLPFARDDCAGVVGRGQSAASGFRGSGQVCSSSAARGPLQRGKTMHRSSKRRRQQLARSPLSKTLRWKRALWAAACAASVVTGSLVWGQEIAPARRKLPTRPVTPVALTREAASEALAPILRPEDLKATAAAKSAPATKLLGAPRSVFRPVAIEAIPAESKPEVNAKPIPSKPPIA